ncbi:MAG: sulfite exporter TauE/SafE family protein [Desulfobacterales bacterium]|nr:sulfite exporter TauE/SafE family protein [Desulfobacterales bacterium]
MTIFSIIGLASLLSGFLSGMVGIGGGIIMAPILIFLPAWIGLPPLSMKVVAGLTITQGLIGCLLGTIHHKKFNFVSGRLLAYMGIPIFLMSFIGGYLSNLVSNALLLILFATLALAAAILIFISVKGDSENPDVHQLKFKRSRAVMASAGVGLLGGMVGQGGSFILIPLMTSYVQIPTRIAIGSNLAIVTLAASAGFLGKAISGQIEWWFTLPILISTIPATYIGSLVSKQVSFVWLKRILAVLIGFAAVRIWISILWA